MSIEHLYNQQNKSIEHAKLTWNDKGEPSSPLFDDIYFSTSNGLAESLYVFIEQNKLYERWLACEHSFYVIGETGFGSGLNLLVTWQAFDTFCTQHPEHILKRLHFISFEKYPLTKNDLLSAHSRWPELSEQASQLQSQYPMAIAGCHRLNLHSNNSINNQLIIDLWIGDINETISQISCPNIGVVDSWYLDGFAPTKNPDMWHQGLYDNMAKLSKDNASLATFTAAGDVRRGLQKSGFLINKVKGFGKKREMITASFLRKNITNNQSPWFHRPAIETSNKDEQKTKSSLSPLEVTIIGGGIASAAMALALAKRGINSCIICQDSMLAQGASGNLQGGFYPLVNAQHDHLSQFYTQASGFGLNYYRHFFNQKTTNNKLGEFCGVIQIAHNEKTLQAHDKIITSNVFPTNLVTQVNDKQGSTIAGIDLITPALYYPQGGWLSPKLLTQAIIKQAQTHAQVNIHYNMSIKTLNHQNNHWWLASDDDIQLQSNIVILANGHGLSQFEQTQHLPLYATAGQVSHVETFDDLSALKTVLCYQGYLTPKDNNGHCLGASFNRDTTNYDVNDEEHAQNIDKLTGDLPDLTQESTLKNHINGGKVGVRMSVKDHLPMVGSVPDYQMTKHIYNDLSKGKPANSYKNSPVHPNLFMLGGLGSRGLCSSPLLAELLACQLTGEPMPLPLSLVNQLNPNRYWIKQLKKHNVDI